MALYSKLRTKPTLFFATTGMSLARFQALMPQFEQAYAEREAQRKRRVVKTGAERQRAAGGGPPFSTDLAERLLMLLVYYRVYVTQEFLTLLFEVEHKSTISRAIAQMRPVFEAVLPVPERARSAALGLARAETERRSERARSGARIGNVADFVREYPELSVLIDGTEQPKQRPRDKKRRTSHYSGKKKRHTLKQIITATPSGLILDQSPAVGGRCHDFRAFKEHVAGGDLAGGGLSGDGPSEGGPVGGGAAGGGAALMQAFAGLRVVCTVDSGFTGIEKLALPITTRVVERARRNHPLTPQQKVLRRVRSRDRIKVEHAIGHRKRYRIASAVYRNRDEIYDATMNVVAGLVNLDVYDRIAARTGLDLLAVGAGIARAGAVA
jgi:hypothetical protein